MRDWSGIDPRDGRIARVETISAVVSSTQCVAASTFRVKSVNACRRRLQERTLRARRLLKLTELLGCVRSRTWVVDPLRAPTLGSAEGVS
jgi:hypothetical protein